jgi:flagellar L-ring protein precursor FlgH
VIRASWSLLLIALAAAQTADGQSSSLMRLPPRASGQNGQDCSNGQNALAARGQPADCGPSGPAFTALPPKEMLHPGTRAIEMTSLIAVPPLPPRKFKVNDLVNIIVRQQKQYQADGKLNTKDEWNLEGKLSQWFRIWPRNRLGASTLSVGDPAFQWNSTNENKMKGENERQDKFITYIQATIIDVKPNGNLVLEAKMEEQHDEERFSITLTGVCRSEDVTPTNSILSTQIANLVLVEKNHGALRDATKRGWIPKILDFTKLF